MLSGGPNTKTTGNTSTKTTLLQSKKLMLSNSSKKNDSSEAFDEPQFAELEPPKLEQAADGEYGDYS